MIPPPAEILLKALARKQRAFPDYSRRALARDLELSPAFLAKTLTGEKNFPPKHLARVSKILALDPYERNLLARSILFQGVKDPDLKDLIKEDFRDSQLAKHRSQDPTKFRLLQDWYNVALLDLSTTEGFQAEPAWIARRLGIELRQAQDALRSLIDIGALEKTSATSYRKTESHTIYPTSRAKQDVQNFHGQMIAKAQAHLRSGRDVDFGLRLITGITTALNREHRERIKKMIFEFLGQVSQTATDGPCHDVYQLNVQFFPLTKEEP